MRKLRIYFLLLLFCLLLFSAVGKANSDKAANLETDADLFALICDITQWSVPGGYQMEGFLRTDLNDDAVTDVIISLTSKDEHRRMLVVMMSNENGYQIFKNENALPYENNKEDSFAGINAGSDFIALYSQGANGTSYENEYVFARKDNQFQLKSISSVQWQTQTGAAVHNMFDFQTGQYMLEKGVMQNNQFVFSDEDVKHDFSQDAYFSTLDTFGMDTVPVTWDDFVTAASIQTETAEKIYCNACGQSFTTGDEFRNHNCLQEVTPELMVCDVCGKQFAGIDAFQNHTCVNVVVQSIVCSVCGSQFSQNDAYDRHLCVSYPEENLVYCDVCGQWYAEGDAFRGHECMQAGIEASE